MKHPLTIEDGLTEADIVTALAEGAARVPEDPKLRSRLLASLGRPGRYGIFADGLARLFDLPIEAAEGLTKSLDKGANWMPWFVPGIELIPLEPGPSLPGAIASLGRLKPGTRFPKHAHLGYEITLVLEGSFRDESGVEIGRGDELFKPAGSNHDFVVLDGEDCIAAVLLLGGADML